MEAPKLILSPMAGVTDWAFRTIAAECGAYVTVTEMVSSRALCYGDKKTKTLLRKNAGSLCGLQIFGSEPEFMARAAKIGLQLSGCDFLDINMGCPMPKVANHGDGAGLLRSPARAEEVVQAVVEAAAVPVTVKMRLGWDHESINCVEIAQRVERAGAAGIAVHGRTRSQMYSGQADWDAIRAVKEAVQIPVAANGDVAEPMDAVRILQRTGADHVMIGRAALGNPWIFQQARAALEGQDIPKLPPIDLRFRTAVQQITLAAEDKGEHIACLEARKQLCWYLHGVPNSGIWKKQISQISVMEDVYRISGEIQENLR